MTTVADVDLSTWNRYPTSPRLRGSNPFNLGISYGWNESEDFGTTADYYVDASVVSSGVGTSVGTAFKTIQEGVNQVITDGTPKTIAVVAGTYRETVNLDDFAGLTGNHSIIKGYGTDKPTITAAEALTGWTQCAAGDSTDVGSNYASIYKVVIAKSSVASSEGLALNLHENGVLMHLATDRADVTERFWLTDESTFHSGLLNEGATYIESVTDATVFAAYTQVQIENAYFYLYSSPNSVETAIPVDSYTAGTHTAAIDSVTYQRVKEDSGNANWNNYSLINILPAMAAGQYGHKDNGDGNITVYCWPTDITNLTANIAYSSRNLCVSITPTTNYISLQGLKFIQASAANDTVGELGCGVSTQVSSLEKKTDITIQHCYSGGHFNADAGYGAFYLSNVDNLVLEYCTIENVQNSFGFFLAGGSSLTQSVNGRVRNLYVKKSERSPARFFTQTDIQFTYSKLEQCGRAAHSNQINFYEQCDKVLVYGIRTTDCWGYMTFQEASDVYIGCCEIPVGDSGSPGRAFIDQNNGTNNPAGASVGYIYLWNNTFWPISTALGSSNALVCGSNNIVNDNLDYYVYNNVAHGRSSFRTYGDLTDTEGNVFTSTDSEPLKGATDQTEVYTDTFVDAANSDFTYKSTSAVITDTGFDMASTMTTIEAIFTDFDFSKDINGDTIAWATPQIGCAVNPTTN